MKRDKIMKALKLILMATAINFCFINSQAQNSDYGIGIGLRIGETSGATLKLRSGSGNASEGIVGFWPDAFSITGLFERYVGTTVPGLNWYYGGGGHIAFLTGGPNYYYNGEHGRYYFYHYGGNVGLGIDGIVGIEYKIPPVPIALSLDLKPFVEFNTNGFVYLSLDPGFGLKIAF